MEAQYGMKISNWCILFSVLFCGMILYTDLRFRYTMEAQYTMEEYNRIFDRAADDALTDQPQEEYWDGDLKIDEEKVQNRFFEQTAYVLDLTGETEKENLKELVLLRKLVNEKGKKFIRGGEQENSDADGEYHKSKVKAY